MAKFKIDENLPVEAAELLCGAGHDALTTVQQRMGGRGDADVARACQLEGRAIATLDQDFADIRAYPPGDYAGIIVLRFRSLDKPRVLSCLQRLLPVLEQEQLSGRLWIVDEASIRVRA